MSFLRIHCFAAPVHLLHGEHVADLGVLVRLGRAELFSVNHADGALETLFKARQVPKVGLRWDLAANLIGVVRDGTQNDAPTREGAARR